MKAIGWLLILVGIGAGIDAFHGNSPYKSLVGYLQGTGAVPAGGSVPVPATAGSTGLGIIDSGVAALNGQSGSAGGSTKPVVNTGFPGGKFN